MKKLLLLFSLFLLPCRALAMDLDKAIEEAIEDAQSGIFQKVENAKNSVLDVREKTLKEQAYAYGVQAGANFRQKQILDVLEKNKMKLDKAYDFSFLMIEGQVVPPVIIGGEQFTTSDKKATRIMQTYVIKTQPRFASLPPGWRDYLYTEYQPPKKEVFDKTLMPKNKDEEKLIKKQVAEGFMAGIGQADHLYTINKNRLNRDFKGMVLFHQLVKRNIIAMPKVKRGDLGITINGTELKIGETVFTVDEAQFNNPRKWKP